MHTLRHSHAQSRLSSLRSAIGISLNLPFNNLVALFVQPNASTPEACSVAKIASFELPPSIILSPLCHPAVSLTHAYMIVNPPECRNGSTQKIIPKCSEQISFLEPIR